MDRDSSGKPGAGKRGASRRGVLAGLAASAALPGAGAAAADPYRVEVRRDSFGVPHILADTDAGAAFGAGWAQAQDGWDPLEDTFLRSLGRGAERHGEKAFDDDRLVRALEIPRLAREELARSSVALRRICEGYAAGINRYAREQGKAFIAEPWHCLAVLRYKYYVLEFLDYAGFGRDGLAFGARTVPDRPHGSNAWAVSPAKSASGHAMLLINPHVRFFGTALYYECHVSSAQGLNFYGVGRLGLPFPYMGFNESLGWAHTDNYPDIGDLYVEDIDPEGRTYAFGGRRLPVETWREDIAVARADGTLGTRTVEFARTRHGPVVEHRNGKPLTVKLARLREGGWLEQWLAMAKARSLTGFKRALARAAIPYMNIVYADGEGNILYVYNGSVPVRAQGPDWSAPVDGSDPSTEWRGYHAFDDLPQVLNPACGYVQNCNSTPFGAARGHSFGDRSFPPYMIGPETDNVRAQVSREILEERQQFSFDEWTVIATDSRLHVARGGVAEIVEAWKALTPADPDRAALRPLVDLLAAWDGRASVDSEATTLFVRWFSRRRNLVGISGGAALDLLKQAKAELEALRGGWRIAWGELNRLQRMHWSGEGRFDDNAPSWPVRGAPGWLGTVFNFYSEAPEGTTRRYGRWGNSFVAVVEFGAMPKARSIRVFGQSFDPASPHHTDQAALYAAGGFKTVCYAAADLARETTPTRVFGA